MQVQNQFTTYSGQEDYTGEVAGKGFTKNIAMPVDTKGDTWIKAFKEAYTQISEEFKDFQLVYAGFGAHIEDPFRLMDVKDEHYEECFDIIKESSLKYSSGRCGFLLEGGYSPEVLKRLTDKLVKTFIS